MANDRAKKFFFHFLPYLRKPKMTKIGVDNNVKKSFLLIFNRYLFHNKSSFKLGVCSANRRVPQYFAIKHN